MDQAIRTAWPGAGASLDNDQPRARIAAVVLLAVTSAAKTAMYWGTGWNWELVGVGVVAKVWVVRGLWILECVLKSGCLPLGLGFLISWLYVTAVLICEHAQVMAWHGKQ